MHLFKRKFFWVGDDYTYMISNEEMNESKEWKGGLLGMLLAVLSADLLRHMLACKRVIQTDERTIKAGQDF